MRYARFRNVLLLEAAALGQWPAMGFLIGDQIKQILLSSPLSSPSGIMLTSACFILSILFLGRFITSVSVSTVMPFSSS